MACASVYTPEAVDLGDCAWAVPGVNTDPNTRAPANSSAVVAVVVVAVVVVAAVVDKRRITPEIPHATPTITSTPIAPRMTSAIKSESTTGGRNWYSRSVATRASVQCHASCVTNADATITPIRSGTAWANTQRNVGTASANTAICANSTPILNAASDVSRCAPANGNCSRSAVEKPKPCTNPNAKAIIHRCCTRAPTMFSTAMYTMDSAINTSTKGGNHSASGANPVADATNVIECAMVNAVTTPTSGRTARMGSTRHSTNSR